MAASRCVRLRWLAAVALLGAAFGCARAALAQVGVSGSLAGRLTDLYSKPLGGVSVTLRNTLTGVETRTTTAKNGDYHFGGLAPGEYTLVAASAQKGQGRLEGIEVAAGFEQHVTAAVQLTPAWAAQNAETQNTGTQVADADLDEAPEVVRPAAKMPRLLMVPGLPVLVEMLEPAVALDASAEPVDAELAPEMNAAEAKAHAQIAGLTAAQAILRANAAVEAPSTDATPLSSASLSLSGEEVRSLPVAGRDWQQFTLSGVPAGNQISGAEGSEFGDDSRPGGALAVDGTGRGLAFGSRGMSRTLNVTGQDAPVGGAVSDSAVHGIDVAGNGQTHVESRSGGAKLQAEASLFTRQNLWGAQNPFSQWVQETAPATLTTIPVFTGVPYTPVDRETTWSVGVGGPMRHFRMNWFAAIEGSGRNDPGVATVKEPENFFAQPTNDEMQVLSARLALPGANPVAEGLAAYSAMLESLAGLLGPAPRTSSTWAGFGRIDWAAAERHRFTVEGSGSRTDSPGGGLNGESESYGNHSFGARKMSDAWLLARWEAFLTPNLLAVTQVSAGRQIVTRPAGEPSAFEQAFNINTWGQLPQMVVDSRYGFTIGNSSRFGAGSYPDEHSYEAQEGVDWIHGRLLIKAGADWRHDDDATSLLRNHTGTYHYARVENFAADALVFAKYGLSGALNPMDQHNCDERGKAWRDADGQLHGLGYLPCYSWYSQTLGPTDWNVSTNDFAGFATAQWEPAKMLVISAALRWEREQIPPPIALVNNPGLPLTQKSPVPGNEWGPRVGLAWGSHEGHWPVLQVGYGMYFGRTPNSVLESAMSQTGSPNGDMSFFLRPTDNLAGGTGGAPPFPYVLAGQPGALVTPGAVAFAQQFRNPEIHQGVASVEESLPGHLTLSVRGSVSLARRLPVTVDTNYEPMTSADTITYAVVDASGAGPIKSPQVTIPFYASWPAQAGTNGRLNPGYEQITQIMSRANSTYEAGTVRLSRAAHAGLSFHLLYTYAHAMDWNPNESSQVLRASVLDPSDFQEEYGTSDLDMRHSASGLVLWQTPWKLTGRLGALANGWSLAGTGHYRSGLPYTMRTAGSIPEEFLTSGGVIAGLGPGMNGYGGDNRVYGIGRNTYRYPDTWKADVRLVKRLAVPHVGELELMAESFNLFNHQNVTEIETTGYYIEPGDSSGSLPTLNFMTGLKTGTTEFGQPLNVNATDYYRPRQIDFGLRLRFLSEPDDEH